MRVIILSQQNFSTLFRYFRGYLHAQSMLLELARTLHTETQVIFVNICTQINTAIIKKQLQHS